jgi:hypothetical protein
MSTLHRSAGREIAGDEFLYVFKPALPGRTARLNCALSLSLRSARRATHTRRPGGCEP